MDDLRQDSLTGLPTEYLVPEYLEESCFIRSVLIGTPVDFKRFYLHSVPWQRFSTINIREAERFIGHWLTKKWGKTCKSIFPKKRSLDVFLGPYRETSVSKIPPPPKKKIDFFSDWVSLFETCFRSSMITDPRPCPTGWEALSRSTKTCQAQISNKLSTAKIDIF